MPYWVSMGYQKEDIMESRTAYRAYNILKQEAMYGGQLAEEISEVSSAESLRNLLRVMDEVNILRTLDASELAEGQGGRKKFYAVDIEGLYDFWFEQIRLRIEDRLSYREVDVDIDKEEDIQKVKDEIEGAADKFRQESDLGPHGQAYLEIELLDYALWTHKVEPKLRGFFRTYAPVYLKFNDESTFEEMLFQDLKSGLVAYRGEEFDQETELDELTDLLTVLSGKPSGSRAASIAAEKTLKKTSI